MDKYNSLSYLDFNVKEVFLFQLSYYTLSIILIYQIVLNLFQYTELNKLFVLYNIKAQEYLFTKIFEVLFLITFKIKYQTYKLEIEIDKPLIRGLFQGFKLSLIIPLLVQILINKSQIFDYIIEVNYSFQSISQSIFNGLSFQAREDIFYLYSLKRLIVTINL